MQPPADGADATMSSLSRPGTWAAAPDLDMQMTASLQREIARIRRICFLFQLSANPIGERREGGGLGRWARARIGGRVELANPVVRTPGCIWPYLTRPARQDGR